MKLTFRTEYALRALIALGLRHDSGIIAIQVIADEQKIPKRFLEQILNDLRSAGFVESKRGVSGGYRLARPPQAILLSDVLALLENFPSPPASHPPSAASSEPSENAQSAIREVVFAIQDAVFHSIAHLSLETLCQRTSALNPPRDSDLNYMI